MDVECLIRNRQKHVPRTKRIVQEHMFSLYEKDVREQRENDGFIAAVLRIDCMFKFRRMTPHTPRRPNPKEYGEAWPEQEHEREYDQPLLVIGQVRPTPSEYCCVKQRSHPFAGCAIIPPWE